MNLEEQIRNAQAFKAAREDAIIYGLLCKWISETEPTIVYGPGFEVLGLAGPNGELAVRRASAQR